MAWEVVVLLALFVDFVVWVDVLQTCSVFADMHFLLFVRFPLIIVFKGIILLACASFYLRVLFIKNFHRFIRMHKSLSQILLIMIIEVMHHHFRCLLVQLLVVVDLPQMFHFQHSPHCCFKCSSTTCWSV